jgi:hypothetical protein
MDRLLHHENHFNDEIKVSKLEWSTNQIKNKINTNGLKPVWLEKLHDYNHNFVNKEMLKRFGYDLTLGADRKVPMVRPGGIGGRDFFRQRDRINDIGGDDDADIDMRMNDILRMRHFDKQIIER